MASRTFVAWRLAATIAAHHWLLTAGMSTRANNSNGTSAWSRAYGCRSVKTPRRRSANHCFWNADAATVASSWLSAMPRLLQSRGSGHHRVEPCVIGRGWPLVRIATQTDVWNATRVQHVTERGIVPTEHRIVRGQRHDDGLDLVEPALRHAAQRVNGCTRTDRVGSIFVGERGYRVVVDPRVLTGGAASP